MKKQFKFHKIPPLLNQLLIDLKPAPERLNLRIVIEEIKKEVCKSYCEKNGDNDAYQKMSFHELAIEPVEKVLIIKEKDGKKIEKKALNKILVDLGYNVNVLFSKNYGCDYDAAISINGYSIPGWSYFVKILRKINSNAAVFAGKRFAPGNSRLHIRIYEGNKSMYIIAHIDKYNWTSFNLAGIKESHLGSGNGNYKEGGRYFKKSLEYYFNV
jgi:hypothetical protein